MKRRGFVLLVVLVAVMLAVLAATRLAWSAGSERAGRAGAVRAMEQRTAARSAVAALQSILGDQRERVLRGRAPQLDPWVELFEAGGDAVVMRFLPVDGSGELVVGEASRLDANGADEAALVSAGLSGAEAAAVVAARNSAPGGRMAAIEEARIAPQRLYAAEPASGPGAGAPADPGSASERERAGTARDAGGAQGAGRSGSGAAKTPPQGGGKRGGGSSGGSSRSNDGMSDGAIGADSGDGSDAGAADDAALMGPPEPQSSGAGSEEDGASGTPVTELLTVFSVEPALTRGGAERLRLTDPWQESLAAALGDTLGADGADRIKSLAGSGWAPADDASLLGGAIRLGLPPARWHELTDLVTVDQGPWRTGRVDINRASAQVLQTLPGLTPELAARMVRERASLSDDEWDQIGWPAVHGILTAEQMAALGGAITTRSYFWRVVVEVGVAPAERPESALQGSTVLEVVIDLTGEQPRVAWLRDVTLRNLAGKLLRQRPEPRADAADAKDAKDANGGALPGGTLPPDQGDATEAPAAGMEESNPPPDADEAAAAARAEERRPRDPGSDAPAPDPGAEPQAGATSPLPQPAGSPPPAGRYRRRQ